MHFHEFFWLLVFQVNFKFFIFYAYFYLFIFYVFYFVTSFSRKLNFIIPNIPISIPLISITFLITKNHKLHTILFYYFQSHKIHFQKFKENTNFNKFTQNAYFTLILFLSPQIVHLDSSSHITPHHYPTHHDSPPKIIKKVPKTHFFCKIPNYHFLPAT